MITIIAIVYPSFQPDYEKYTPLTFRIFFRSGEITASFFISYWNSIFLLFNYRRLEFLVKERLDVNYIAMLPPLAMGTVSYSRNIATFSV
jgi:hypothetical protein